MTPLLILIIKRFLNSVINILLMSWKYKSASHYAIWSISSQCIVIVLLEGISYISSLIQLFIHNGLRCNWCLPKYNWHPTDHPIPIILRHMLLKLWLSTLQHGHLLWQVLRLRLLLHLILLLRLHWVGWLLIILLRDLLILLVGCGDDGNAVDHGSGANFAQEHACK